MWFIIGIIMGALAVGLLVLFRAKNIRLKWWEWILGIVGLLLLLFTIQNFIGTLNEEETKAAWMMLVLPGIPAIILMASAVVLPYVRLNKREV